jgi:hypothetical protein
VWTRGVYGSRFKVQDKKYMFKVECPRKETSSRFMIKIKIVNLER